MQTAKVRFKTFDRMSFYVMIRHSFELFCHSKFLVSYTVTWASKNLSRSNDYWSPCRWVLVGSRLGRAPRLHSLSEWAVKPLKTEYTWCYGVWCPASILVTGVTVYTPSHILNQSEVVVMFQSGVGIEVVENIGYMTARVYLPMQFMVRVFSS